MYSAVAPRDVLGAGTGPDGFEFWWYVGVAWLGNACALQWTYAARANLVHTHVVLKSENSSGHVVMMVFFF